MKIKLMIRLLVLFYLFLIFLVSYKLYDLYIGTKTIDTIRETRYAILERIDKKNYTEDEKHTLDSSKEKILEIIKTRELDIIFIYSIMIIAVFSLILTYLEVRRKILKPVYDMNEIIMAFQNGESNIKEFPSNDDEIGLMIKEFFIMKRMHDADYEQLEKLALTDPLTNILNRRAFFEISEKILRLSLRNEKTFSILLLDIDFFKKVNDVYGHLVGDDILKYLVENVQSDIRESDIFARFGGEEFILLLPDTDETGALALANKIRESIEMNPYSDEKLSIPITISIGVSELKGEKLLRELIHRADEALYSAKENGRNRVEVN